MNTPTTEISPASHPLPGEDTSMRGAGDAGSPTPAPTASSVAADEQAQSEPTHVAGPDAPRTLLPLEIERALKLVRELVDLQDIIGPMHPTFGRVPRDAFDAIPAPGFLRGQAMQHGDEWMWAKHLYLGDHLVTFYCFEPPADWVAPPAMPFCRDCKAKLTPEKHYPADATQCRRCAAAERAGEDAA